MHLGRGQVTAELLFGVPGKGSRRVEDLRPAAVVEGHEEGDPLVVAVFASAQSTRSFSSPATPSAADEAHPHAPPRGSGVSRSISPPANIAISPSTSSLGRVQFSVENE